MFIDVNDVEGPVEHISNLELIGSYSIDGERRYCEGLSQLKYYKEPPDVAKVNFDLKLEAGRICKYEGDWKLDFILKWISNHFDLLKTQESEKSSRWLQPEIVCVRGALKTLFTTPFEGKYDWIICASKFKGTIYLCSFDTEEKKRNELEQNAYAKSCSRWGYKFEQYMLSDKPDRDPDLSVPLNENEEFCCMFKAKFGKTNLLYGAEMDGTFSQEFIEDTVVGKDLKFIELKTIHHKEFKHGEMKNFIKTLNWWSQSYLVGIEDIICGCKDYNGVVTKIKKLNLNEFHRIRVPQQTCKRFCNTFLERMKEIVCEEYDKILYKFTYSPSTRKIRVQKMKPDPKSEYTFLHSWYINKAKEHFAEIL